MSTENSAPPTTPGPSATRRLPLSWTAELQRRLLVIYGERLERALTDEDASREWIETWSETLAWVTAEQIAHGLLLVEAAVKKAAREGRSEWPLSSVEFKALCETATFPLHRAVPRVEMRRQPSAKARECMAEIRRILRMPDASTNSTS